jgi:apolipoprotein N-acyltransferase
VPSTIAAASRRPLTLRPRLRLAAAVLAGVAVGLSWEPYGWWPLLALGIPVFTMMVFGVPQRRAFGLGYGFGLGLLTVAISWVYVLGWWVAVLLILFEALFFGLLGIALSLSSRLRFWPLFAAASWVAIEFAYSRVPFGGFGWTRLAYAVVDTPLNGFFPVIGVAGVSFLTVAVCELLLLGAWATQRSRDRRQRVLVLMAVATIVLAGLGLRRYQVEPLAGAAEPLQVGIVQGNVPGRGIEALGRMRSVTNNHLAETVNLTARWRLGQVAEPDFLLWPENSTDIDPMVDSVTYATVQAAAGLSGKPILVGAVTRGPGEDERQTTALWWDPVQRVLARYNKQNLVPFGEWIPFRKQLLPLLPILREVGAQSVPGTEPGVLTVPVDNRTVRIGDIICFELAYDRTVYETVRGAEVLVVQSNNATYGGTGQIEQQFAITRARAMEARREIAVATTNSVSGFIDRDGRVVERTQEFTAASTVVEMPVRRALTLAIVVAPWLNLGLALLGLLGSALGWATRRSATTRRYVRLVDAAPVPAPESEPALLAPSGAGRQDNL